MGRPLPVLSPQKAFRGRGPKRAGSLDDIVAAYRTDYAYGASVELDYFKRLGSIKVVLTQAGLARGHGGKKFRHQFRIPNRVLQRSADALVRNAAAIQRCRAFDDLIQTVEHVIRPLKGIGNLTVYDTAVRIGAFLGCGPEKVFLHAGTKKGAEALGFDGKRAFLSPEEMPRAFQQLTPREIEDCLCIYKRQLRRIGQQWRNL